MRHLHDTIVAIATAIVPQQGSIGIVRLSGAKAVAIAQSLFEAPGKQHWQSHRILYGYVRDPQTGERVDEALLLLMLAPRSYTREDVVEFHCHGGLIPVQRVLQLCVAAGARLAEPGEFTLRAFLNGRLDLTQAESVAELVAAQSTTAAQIALAGLTGKLARPLKQIRQTCLSLLVEIEARLDFTDELPPLDPAAIAEEIRQLQHQVEAFLATAERGALIRTGLKVAIVGRPNVGKSSLLNAWSRSDRAIVTDLPGTTRDIVESQLVVGGIPIQVLDTAGIRETDNLVEQIGVERARQAAATADLILFVIDASQGWTAADQEIYDQLNLHQRRQHSPQSVLVVLNKADLLSETVDVTDIPLPIAPIPTVLLSALSQRGIEQLEQAILDLVQGQGVTAANLDFALNQRQAALLEQVHQSLNHVLVAIDAQLPLDFWTIDLHAAARALGTLTGEEVTESVLEQIFSRFCIGK
ncbi:tRNA uridine-5-carboxymethylaminomethyl(34) synthesis GTPase MnmE [Thermosynechococcus sp. HN-54]|uniref:tRNA uridine-5-carboxymethylaminomethyl(34) synthesis GTPase MnmE n=1 Tax=Thermosynechococcus sp. HN-54 TaxID=2933959 RepID=UPI00202CC4A5|nr:tRNA uridine-5-carboxymethylaminomethyl(34) synthesis GTPase MnmE [Thermosynechococcus sp. HN-54]URR34761.1 tRNA uridine-5-carboxymethylaminomethyl(34) synthesis GTPase MnmE [Thermosynechococcus sp. HN-54]